MRSQMRWQVYRAVRMPVFYEILAPWGCGSMDGGCVLTAVALHDVLGGTLYSVYTKHWQHACLLFEGIYLDGDGGAAPGVYEAQWQRRYGQVITLVRERSDQFLVDAAAYTPEAHKALTAYFKETLWIATKYAPMFTYV